jgi:6-pyruvoyltetrahydropterin/6-carboxytetrahydropterin synthase
VPREYDLVVVHTSCVLQLKNQAVTPALEDRRGQWVSARRLLIAQRGKPVIKGTCMFRVTREIEFCYGHRLLNYDGKCRHLHGHTGRAVITLQGSGLDARGMLVDFAEIKRKVQHWIEENLDHNMLLCRDDPLLPLLQDRGERVFEMDCNPTAENIARLIFEHARGTGLPVVEVLLWETEHCVATYAPAT